MVRRLPHQEFLTLATPSAGRQLRRLLRRQPTEAKVSYKRPARYDDLIAVETRLGELGRVSLRFDYRVVRGDDLLALGHTVHACVSRDGEIRERPEPLLAQLRG